MTDYKYQVPRLRDKDVFKFFRAVSKIVKAPNFSISEANSGKSRTFNTNDDQNLDSDRLYNSDLYTIYSATTGTIIFLSRCPAIRIQTLTLLLIR